jgi:hypothetical protein
MFRWSNLLKDIMPQTSNIIKYFRTCSIPFKTSNAGGVAVSSKYQYNFELNTLGQQQYRLYIYLRHLLSILTMF